MTTKLTEVPRVLFLLKLHGSSVAMFDLNKEKFSRLLGAVLWRKLILKKS